MSTCTGSPSTRWSTGCGGPGQPAFSRDARQVPLSGFGLRPGERFTYEYDFFAGWRHDIRVEQILPRSPRRRYPACTGGARQAPPEDCGSPEEFLALRRQWPPVLIAARMTEILSGLLDADGDTPAGEAIGDQRDELARLLDLARLDKLDRTALNSALHALDINPESVSDGGSSEDHRSDTRHIVLRTLFGTLRLESPRFRACPCAAAGPATVSPVAALLPERTTPELLLWEARYAALTSYGAAASLLSEAFPLGRTLQATAVRQQVERTAARLEDELGEERFSFIDTCPAEWEEMPRPGLPLVVTLDGGYVHSSRQTSRKDGWFEAVTGTSTPGDGGPAKAFA